MIKLSLLSQREKYIAFAVAAVLMALMADVGMRAWHQMAAAAYRRGHELQQQWDYTAAILNRAASIEAKYNAIQTQYSKLFERDDTTRVMSDLDAVAKAAGVQVQMIRPLQGDKSSRYELTLKGSWVQVMKFLQEAEGPASLFDFPVVAIHRQEPSGDLLVSVQVERKTF